MLCSTIEQGIYIGLHTRKRMEVEHGLCEVFLREVSDD